MAGRMQENQVVQRITPAQMAGHDVMDVPSRVVRDRVLTVVALAFLPSEERRQLPAVSDVAAEAADAALLAVGIPFRIERIVVRLHLDMPSDRDVGCFEQPNALSTRRFHEPVDEHPGSSVDRGPITVLDPLQALVSVSSLCPTPQGVEQPSIDRGERLLGNHVPMVVRPATNDRVQQSDKVVLSGRRMGLDRLPCLAEERLHVLPRRLDEQLAAVGAEVPSEKVKAPVNMDDARLRVGEPKPSFRKERTHQRQDLVRQDLFRGTGDDEVVRIAHQIDLRSAAELACVRLEMRAQQRLQSIQSKVRQRGRDDPSLRRSRLRPVEPAEVNDSGVQPFSQHDPVHGDMGR